MRKLIIPVAATFIAVAGSAQKIDTAGLVNTIKKYIIRDKKATSASFTTSCAGYRVSPYFGKNELLPFFGKKNTAIAINDFRNCDQCIGLNDFLDNNGYMFPRSQATIILYPVLEGSVIARVVYTPLLITETNTCWFQGENSFYFFHFNRKGKLKKKKRYVLHMDY